MKKYRFITIEDISGEYIIYNNKSNEAIGGIIFCGPWKRWVFDAGYESVWSTDCLRNVISFIENEIPR